MIYFVHKFSLKKLIFFNFYFFVELTKNEIKINYLIKDEV